MTTVNPKTLSRRISELTEILPRGRWLTEWETQLAIDPIPFDALAKHALESLIKRGIVRKITSDSGEEFFRVTLSQEPDKKPRRRCLRCGVPFDSTGNENRMCVPCRRFSD